MATAIYAAMLRAFFLTAVTLLLTLSVAAEAIPPGSVNDLSRTPGATNPDITQDNIKQTICNKGHWTTKSIRPPTSYTNKLKKKQIVEYGFKDKNMKDYEEDHLISLTIGGSPTDPKNLWPERYSGKWGARIKDKLENRLNKLICNGTLTLKEAQTCIAENWIECYKREMNQ
jgi:hypothetical protein